MHPVIVSQALKCMIMALKPIHIHNKDLIAKSLTACEVISSSLNVMGGAILLQMNAST